MTAAFVCAVLLAGSGSAIAAPVTTERGVPGYVDPVPVTGRFVTGIGVPWAVGMSWGGDTGIAAEWPPFHVRSLRLWDTRTTWADLERRRGERDFARIDQYLDVAAANGTSDVMLTLAGTPEWAAMRILPGDASWIGPGSASPPSDLRAWSDYVGTLAHRYRGRITTYELGNEPNLPMFWSGSPVEYALFILTAGKAIRAVDPSARIIANVGVIRRNGDIVRAALLARLMKGYRVLDGLSVHFYPSTKTLSTTTDLMRTMRKRLAAQRPGQPVWITEANVVDGPQLPSPQQGEAIRSLTRWSRGTGYAGIYWYAYTRHGPQNIIQFWPGSHAAAAAAE